MAIALRHLLVLRITRFFSKILAFNRWIKCYSGPPASLILGVNLLFFLGERKLIEKKYGNRPKVELALCDVLITHEGKTGGRLAVGCGIDIWEFHNVPVVCGKLDASDDYPSTSSKHDACYLPRRSHCTGNVDVHEMAFVNSETENATNELVFVNTQFSCLSKRSDENSFEPVWRPKWIKQIAPGDNCHLNGLATRDGQAKYVTALGTSNEPGGWRKNKRNGGLLLDVQSHETIIKGLSMPHSPRWYNGQLWLLESGEGTIGTVDLKTGKYESIAQFPGFTRGLSFLGPLAFIGLSQVRESAVFSGIPLVERLEKAAERTCGVWVLNIETGETLGFCRFEEGVQEIFAVDVLPGIRFPDLINHDAKIVGQSYVLSDAALAEVPQELQDQSQPQSS